MLSIAVKGPAPGHGARGITVNVIQAGPINTDMNPGDGPYAAAQIVLTALGRYGRAEEITAAFITGATINVDGGVLA
jgi:3-oxoacyl-[acyl-carrier protein] reductase